MRLVNICGSPKYCMTAGAVLRPGCASRELDVFSKALEGVLKSISGFEAILSDKDVELLSDLCIKYLLPVFKEKTADMPEDDAKAISLLEKTLSDPDGTKRITEEYRARRELIQRARSAAIARARSKEARIRSESNVIGPDGNPIPKAEMKAASDIGMTGIRPDLHPEMTTDLKSVIENNLAVMGSTSSSDASRSWRTDGR